MSVFAIHAFYVQMLIKSKAVSLSLDRGSVAFCCMSVSVQAFLYHVCTQDYNKQQRLADIRERDSFLTGIQTEKASTMPQASTYSHSPTTHVHKSLHSTLFSDKKPLCAEI